MSIRPKPKRRNRKRGRRRVSTPTLKRIRLQAALRRWL